MCERKRERKDWRKYEHDLERNGRYKRDPHENSRNENITYEVNSRLGTTGEKKILII